MIAKSDVIILVVSASALAAGVYRWQSNMTMISTAQSISSAPTAAVLDSKQSTTYAMANTAQPAASTSVVTNTLAVTNNIATSAPVNRAVVTGNTANNGTQIVSVTNNGNTAARNVVGNANQSNNGNNNNDNNQATGPLYGAYLVRSGDYLGKIAETYGTTVETLRSINNITGSLIEVDQEILYPLPAN